MAESKTATSQARLHSCQLQLRKSIHLKPGKRHYHLSQYSDTMPITIHNTKCNAVWARQLWQQFNLLAPELGMLLALVTVHSLFLVFC